MTIVLGFSRETKPIGFREICKRRLWKLPHMILEAEMSHNMPSVSWRTRQACGIIQSKSKGLRTREATGLSPRVWRPENQELRCLGQENMDVPAQEERKQICFSLAFLFYSGPQLIGWLPPALVRMDFLYLVFIQSNAYLFWKHCHRHRSSLLPSIWASCGPVKLTQNIT